MEHDDRWQVRSLALHNFRCFEHFEIDFDPEFTVLVGVNGTGKTAVLDGLAVLLSTVLAELAGTSAARSGFALSDVRLDAQMNNTSSVPSMERSFPVGGEIAAVLGGQERLWNRDRFSKNGRTTWSEKSLIAPLIAEVWESANNPIPTATLPVVALYSVERLVGVRPAKGTIAKSRRSAYTAALDSKSDLTRLSSYIQGLTLDEYSARIERGIDDPPEARQLKAIRLACTRVLGHTGWSGPFWRQNIGALTMVHPQHGELPLSFLSSGLRIAAGLTIDLASRMARANPALGGDNLLLTAPGIVLIDEIDLHLHPTWQQHIVPSLRHAFPRVQFIVTTHSPQVLSTVPADQVRILDGDVVHKVDYSEGLRSDVVLRKVMGTEPSPSLPITKYLRDYLSMVDAGKGLTEKAKLMRQQLDRKLGGAEMVHGLAAADANIAFYDLDDE